jgi:hypothetical protein
MSIHSKQSGYTLLFAVLVSVLVLGVAVFISGTARKQYILSSTALDSMYSFYAADSGIECVAAAYNASTISTTTGATISCAGSSLSVSFGAPTTPVPSVLNGGSDILEAGPIDFGLAGSTCANIYIFNGDDSSNSNWTIVDSSGYNLCISASHTPDTSSPRTVERTLRWSTK